MIVTVSYITGAGIFLVALHALVCRKYTQLNDIMALHGLVCRNYVSIRNCNAMTSLNVVCENVVICKYMQLSCNAMWWAQS